MAIKKHPELFPCESPHAGIESPAAALAWIAGFLATTFCLTAAKSNRNISFSRLYSGLSNSFPAQDARALSGLSLPGYELSKK